MAVRISVVIPVYNAERTIVRTLESLAAQERRLYEVIVVDDGSTDDSIAQARTMVSGSLPRIEFVTQGNQGVSVARNTGLARATGDYVFFLDADDVVAPEFVRQIELASAAFGETPDLIRWPFSHSAWQEPPRQEFERFWAGRHTSLDTGPDTLRRIVCARSDFMWMGSVAFRRDFLTEIGISFTPGCAVAEDAEFMWKALARAKVILYIQAFLSHYIWRDDSVSRQRDARRFDSASAHLRVARYLQDHFGTDPDGVAACVERRILPIYFRELERHALGSWLLARPMRPIEARNPGLTKEISTLVGEQLGRSTPIARTWRLHSFSPWLAVQAMRVRGLMNWFRRRRHGIAQSASEDARARR